MASAFKLGRQKDVQNPLASSGGCCRPQTEHVGVVVLAGQGGGAFVPHQRGADAGTLLAAMLMPMPVAQTNSPKSLPPAATASPTAWA
jgi:hypothetical protein